MRYPRLRMPASLRVIFRRTGVRRTLFWLATMLGIVWAAPLTLAGLLIAVPIVLFRGRVQLMRGPTVALLVRGPLADYLLQRHPYGAMNAMAIGHVIVSSRQGLSARVLIHELAHVRQAACWGPAFPFAYLASSAWAILRGKDAYWHNRFEVAVRKAEKMV